jgi:23S rRNA-/tRNA-specific pseudouridylate synthase
MVICRTLRLAFLFPMYMRSASTSANRMRHLVVSSAERASNFLEKQLGVTVDDALRLIHIGAVYHQGVGARKPTRIMDNIELAEGDYLRAHLEPKLYPVDDINWTDTILYECEDYVIINKPPLIPCNPTVDNAKQNILECIKLARQYDQLYLPHRLDVETTGLMVLGKSKEFTASMCRLFKERKVRKFYRALIASKSSIPYAGSEDLVHFMVSSSISPKIFNIAPLGDDCLKCEAVLKELTQVKTLSKIQMGSLCSTLTPNTRLQLAVNSWTQAMQELEEISFCEVLLELKTGRTHQVRGQLQADRNWHIAGDEMYRGVTSSTQSVNADKITSKYLGLQSCLLAFSCNDSEVEYKLESVWWTPLLC